MSESPQGSSTLNDITHNTDDGQLLLQSTEDNKKEGEEGLCICLRELKFDFDIRAPTFKAIGRRGEIQECLVMVSLCLRKIDKHSHIFNLNAKC